MIQHERLSRAATGESAPGLFEVGTSCWILFPFACVGVVFLPADSSDQRERVIVRSGSSIRGAASVRCPPEAKIIPQIRIAVLSLPLAPVQLSRVVMYLQMSSKIIKHDVKIDKIGIYIVVKFFKIHFSKFSIGSCLSSLVILSDF
jgi:hypothetical protein